MAISSVQRAIGCSPDVAPCISSHARHRSGWAPLLKGFTACEFSGTPESWSQLQNTRWLKLQKRQPWCKAGGRKSLFLASEKLSGRRSGGQAGSCRQSTSRIWCCSPALQSPSTPLLDTGDGESALANSETIEFAGQASLVEKSGWCRVLLGLALVLLLVWKGSPPALAAATEKGAETGVAAFNFGAFGLRGSLTDRTPGLAYFALLMAAGCGLFVSEEALNVWVGGSLGRCLVVGGTREVLVQSLRANGAYIASVIFWVYWGVCLSDLIPFFAGKWAAQRGESLTEKMGGTSQKTLARVTATVRRYGRYIGFVERFSLGVRNPTAFLAGFSGVSTATFFAGVCAGGALTLPLQMGLGFVLRDRPVAALATVAAIVGTWTVIPYASAALAAAWFFVKQRLDKNEDTRPEP